MANGPRPSMLMYWFDNVDPTAGAGLSAPLNQILIRTDNNTVYYKSGLADTAWTQVGGGGVVVTGVNVQEEGVPIAGNPHQTLNFVGPDVTAINAGGSVANIVVTANNLLLTNDEAGPIVIGTPVYSDANAGCKKAKSNAAVTSDCQGLVRDTTIASTTAGNVCSGGPMVATTAQWDVITGDVGGLVFGARYYVDPATAGKLTRVAPTTATQFVAEVGMATSTTQMVVRIPTPIGPL